MFNSHDGKGNFKMWVTLENIIRAGKFNYTVAIRRM